MTLLITVFLVLVNIFNTITTKIPKAEGLTAIEAWVIGCVLFVFGALICKQSLQWAINIGPKVSDNWEFGNMTFTSVDFLVFLSYHSTLVFQIPELNMYFF